MKYLKFALISMVALSGLAQSENSSAHGPDVRLGKDGRIVGRAAASHVASKSEVVVHESENCAFTKISNTEIQLGSKCEFLNGVYTYEFPGKAGTTRLVLGFSASRQGSSEVFMVNAPIVILAN